MARRGILSLGRRQYRAPDPHPSGERPPKIPVELVPNHVAIVMDGNRAVTLYADGIVTPMRDDQRNDKAALNSKRLNGR